MKVLDGVTVIDFTQTYSGPFCTMQLADFGARVIRIEVKGIDDAARIWPPFSENGESGYYATNNRGKESIALDLKTPEGMEVIKKLIQNADIVVENFKVGKMAQLGLSYADVKKINPEIIYASLTGYGQNGPWNDQPAYDNVIQARSGMMEMTGFPDDVPTKVGPSISDYFGGLNLTLGVVMAYFHKQNTGEGQYIDVAMYDSLFAIMESPILCKDLLNQEATRCGNTDPTLCPYDVYPCKDGYFSVGLAAGSDAEWNRFCIAIDMLIAATALELGSLWLGLYSNQRNELKRLLHLPDYVDPLMLLVFGYAKVKKEPVERYLEERVHFDSYSSKTIFD